MDKRKDFWTGLVLLTAITLSALVLIPRGRDLGNHNLTGVPDTTMQIERAVDWLVREHQNDDGGYSSFSRGANLAPSDVGGTVDAILAIAGGGFDPAGVYPGEITTPVDFLKTNIQAVRTYTEEDGGQAGKLILALVAAGMNPRDFGGVDIVASLESRLGVEGNYGVDDPFKQSLAILGLAGAGEPIQEPAINWLEGHQAENGSWDDGFGTDNNADATALAIMALVAAGKTIEAEAVAGGLEYLKYSQEENGGWAYSPGFGTSANSTAMVIQALAATSIDWYSASNEWSKNGNSPLDALLSFQAQNGSFQSDVGDGLFDDFFATVQSIPALAGKPFPISSD
jgi:hypothetical protein